MTEEIFQSAVNDCVLLITLGYDAEEVLTDPSGPASLIIASQSNVEARIDYLERFADIVYASLEAYRLNIALAIRGEFLSN